MNNDEIDAEIARWRRIVRGDTPTNKAQSERALKRFYQYVKGRPIEQIFWCQSPYQMAVIPPLLVNILNSRQWQVMKAFLRQACEADRSLLWEEAWQSIQFSFADLFDQVMFDPLEFPLCDQVRQSAMKRLKRLLFESVEAGAGAELQARPGKPSAGGYQVQEQYCSAGCDDQIEWFLHDTVNFIELSRGLPDRLSSRFSVIGLPGLFTGRKTGQSAQMRTEDTDSRLLRSATRLTSLFMSLEEASSLLSNWYMRLPPTDSRMDREYVQQLIADLSADKARDLQQQVAKRTISCSPQDERSQAEGAAQLLH